MTIEFNKLVEQVHRMGEMLDKLDFDLQDRMSLALQRFSNASDLNEVWKRIDWVRNTKVSGYRGAAPFDIPDAEPINLLFPEPPAPEFATLIAVDGSQVYPDERAPIHYYLINIGMFIYHHGLPRRPEQDTYPNLVYHDAHVHDRYGRVIRNNVVDDRRTLDEMKKLAQEGWHHRQDEHGAPFLFYDNRLLYFPGENTRQNDKFLGEYFEALNQIRDAGAILAGYVDNTIVSNRFIQLLYLMSLNSEQEVKMNEPQLPSAGDLAGLRDQQLWDVILEPGERSAIMVQNSPQNKKFKDYGHEIAFFYLKVTNEYQNRIVRVDIPAWIAMNPQAVRDLQALILSQCRMQGRNPYPYCLTRADELAVVQFRDKEKLESLVRAELRRKGIHPRAFSAKAWGKTLSRGEKRSFEL